MIKPWRTFRRQAGWLPGFARWSVRNHGAVLGVTLVFALVLALASIGLEKRLSSGGFAAAGTQAAKADALLAERFKARPPDLVLRAALDGRAAPAGKGEPVDSPRVAEAGNRLTRFVRDHAGVATVDSYWATRSPALRADNGRSALLAVDLGGDDARAARTAERLVPEVATEFAPLRVTATGPTWANVEFIEQGKREQRRAELIIAPLAVLILLVAFRSAYAALVPAVIGALSVVGTMAALRLLTYPMQVSVFAPNLATALGFGLAIDYSLFVVTRFREELAAGVPVRRAVERSMGIAGRTVLFSALTVAVAVSGLFVFPVAILRSLACAAIVVVALAAAATILVLPALLAVLGTRINDLDPFARLRRGPRRGRPAGPAGEPPPRDRRPVRAGGAAARYRPRRRGGVAVRAGVLLCGAGAVVLALFRWPGRFRMPRPDEVAALWHRLTASLARAGWRAGGAGRPGRGRPDGGPHWPGGGAWAPRSIPYAVGAVVDVVIAALRRVAARAAGPVPCPAGPPCAKGRAGPPPAGPASRVERVVRAAPVALVRRRPVAAGGVGALLLGVLSWALSRPRRRVRRAADAEDRIWRRVALVAVRHPVVLGGVTAAFLLLLAAPFLHAEFGLADERILPADAEPHATARDINRDFAHPMDRDLRVVLPRMDAADARNRAEVERYARRLSGVRDVRSVQTVTGTYARGGRQEEPEREDPRRPADKDKKNKDDKKGKDQKDEGGKGKGKPAPRDGAGGPDRLIGQYGARGATLLVVSGSHAPQTAGAERMLDGVRAVRPPGERLVTGRTAQVADTLAAMGDALPLAVGVIVVSTLVLLFLFTGGVLVSVKALALGVLSLTASCGAIVAIFQDGRLKWLVGEFTVTGRLEAITLLITFTVAFGLSMDYEVFLLSRIKERYRATGDHSGAVVGGIATTGRLVTAAASVVALSTGFLVTSDNTVLKMNGLGLALAVLVDATIVRGVLVPAFMRLTGTANWWAPAPLARLHERAGFAEESARRSRWRARRPRPSLSARTGLRL